MAHAQYARSSVPSDIAAQSLAPGKQLFFVSILSMSTEDSASSQAGSSAPSAEVLKDSDRELLQEVASLPTAASQGPRDGDRTHGELAPHLCYYSLLLVGLLWWREIGGRGQRISGARSLPWRQVVGGETGAVLGATQVGCNWHWSCVDGAP